MQQQATETLNYRQHNHLIKEPITTTTTTTRSSATICSTSADYHTHGTTTNSARNGQQTSFAYYNEETTAHEYDNNNLGIINDSCSPTHYYTGGNNNNHLENIYYETPTPDDQSQYTTYGPSSNNYLTTQQQANPRDPNTISFDLDDINEVIKGEEFDYQNAVVKQEIDTQHRALPETEAAIYENLKNILIDVQQSDESSSATTPSPAQAFYTPRPAASMAADHQLNNNIAAAADKTDDLFKRAVANNSPASKPYVEIIEQPSKCALRFRYKCEGRSAGSLPGVNSTSDNKTYPTIRINNYKGRAVVVISCVTKDAPYRAHPHNIVGKEGCKKGICTIVLNGNQDLNEANAAAAADESNDSAKQNNREQQTPSPTKDPAQASTLDALESANCMIRTFSSLGIQCVKRKDIEDSLGLRESINVDPFRNGFSHKLDTSAIDLNVVRLCFQVFIEGSSPYKCDIPLTPVVSEPIHDKKAMSDLVITKLSHCSAPATGGREVILLCDRISKDDIQIRFFEESRDGELIWETFSDISAADVHKQVAICFRTPKYYNEEITQPVMARVQLRRISDQQVSEPRLFQFLPCESDEDIISRKRKKVEWCNMNQYALDNILQANPSQQHQQQQHPIQHPQQPHHHQQQYQQLMQPATQQQHHHHQQQQQAQRQQQQQQQHMSLVNRQQQQQ